MLFSCPQARVAAAEFVWDLEECKTSGQEMDEATKFLARLGLLLFLLGQDNFQVQD